MSRNQKPPHRWLSAAFGYLKDVLAVPSRVAGSASETDRISASLDRLSADVLEVVSHQKKLVSGVDERLRALELAVNALNQVDTRIDRLNEQLWMLSGAVAEQRREQQLLLGNLSLPESTQWIGKPIVVPGVPGIGAFPFSTLCRQDSFEQPYFSYWSAQLGYTPRYHRKLWEFVFICQVLYERGALVSGSKGLGFGVGAEPLSAYFIGKGSMVTATDMTAEDAERSGWASSAQHAANVDMLRRPDLCPEDQFEQNITFRSVDMNHIPADLTGFDFCWSACALEHLGSIDAGLDFIRNSVDTLRPGGLAVHTTEFNLSSNVDTLASGGTVLFRRCDIDRLIQRLQADGHEVAPMDYNPGYGAVDRYIDVPPYRAEPHLKLALAGYATTSIGIIVRRAS